MASNLVIAAIPGKDDRVWKVSSEKVPHLTILHLGEVAQVANLESIVQFVEHAANTSLRRFYLPVDRRGELGADQADVLFFKKSRYDFKAVRDFRSLLLKDSNIKTAYDSSTQFETPEEVGEPGQPWIPHLTLGYPASPAKPMPDEYTSLYEVCFDKIAVWTGDYEGTDFLLKDHWDEIEEMGIPMDVPLSVAYSDIEHHGVKGMRWGVTTRSVGNAAKTVGGKVGRAAKGVGRVVQDVNFESRTNVPEDGSSSTAKLLVVRGANKPFQKDLESINAKPEHQKAKKLKNRLLNPLDPQTKAYRAEVKKAYIDRLEKTANSMTNGSGNRQYTIRERGIDLPAQGGALPSSKHFWEVTARNVQHAANEDSILLEVLMDEDGFITGTKEADPEEAKMAHTMELGAAFLTHHGVKGMRWGQRKDEFITRQHQRQSTVEATRREKRPPSDVRAVPTIGTKKRDKAKVNTAGGHDHPPTEDAIKVAVAQQKLKKSGVAALSNQELREVEQRLNLEANVTRLSGGRKTSGQRFVDGLLGRGSKDDRKAVENQVGSTAQDLLRRHGTKLAVNAVRRAATS